MQRTIQKYTGQMGQGEGSPVGPVGANQGETLVQSLPNTTCPIKASASSECDDRDLVELQASYNHGGGCHKAMLYLD